MVQDSATVIPYCIVLGVLVEKLCDMAEDFDSVLFLGNLYKVDQLP